MKKTFAVLMLVLLAVMVGCVEGPEVIKGGGESAVLDENNGQATGRIDVRGHVVNTGESTATGVVLYFKFFQAGTLYLEETLLLGDIPGGGSESFSGTFYGAPVDVASFTWEYRIEWN